jgi:hypothetical protein
VQNRTKKKLKYQIFFKLNSGLKKVMKSYGKKIEIVCCTLRKPLETEMSSKFSLFQMRKGKLKENRIWKGDSFEAACSMMM